jgi:hypothetical protein
MVRKTPIKLTHSSVYASGICIKYQNIIPV